VETTTAVTRRTTIPVRRRRGRSMGRLSVECRAHNDISMDMVFASSRWRTTTDDRRVAVDDDGNDGGRRRTRVHSR
jgi:hypothetical protein